MIIFDPQGYAFLQTTHFGRLKKRYSFALAEIKDKRYFFVRVLQLFNLSLKIILKPGNVAFALVQYLIVTSRLDNSIWFEDASDFSGWVIKS